MSPRAKCSAWSVVLFVVLALGGCRWGSDYVELTDHRVPPKPPEVSGELGLTFPLDPPSATPLVAVRAFKQLNFSRPVFVTAAPGREGELFVVEQAGRIRVFPNREDASTATIFLDIRGRVRTVHNEEGLLGLAFAPDFATSGVFYVYYSASRPRRAQISRFVLAADNTVVDPDSEQVVLAVAQPYGNHNGGTVLFGPDGYLYAGFGDGGAAGDPLHAGQDLAVLLGKIIRIEVEATGSYKIPPGNPFVAHKDALPEIWAYGLRNPWRFAFDRQTGALWVGDVGQDSLEEVDIVRKGGNYGWSGKEGTAAFIPSRVGSESIPPVVEYGRRLGESITGGYVYRGVDLPSFRGAYFYGDYVTGRVWALTHDGERTTSNTLVARVPALSACGPGSSPGAVRERHSTRGLRRICSRTRRVRPLCSPAMPVQAAPRRLETRRGRT